MKAKRRKLLITGSNGLLGNEIKKKFLSDQAFEVYGINRTADLMLDFEHSIEQDFIDSAKTKKILSYINPDIIIHCAALVDIDQCEQDRNYAYKINVESTRELSSYLNSKVRFIYISTDSIFDGKAGNYSELDEPMPLNYYAKTKLEAERAVISTNKNYLILRTNIYGIHNRFTNSKNYKFSLVEWAIESLAMAKQIDGFCDVIFNPLYTKQIADIIYFLIETEYKGILNIGSQERISKYDFLKEVAEEFGYDQDLVRKGFISESPLSVIRPLNTTLCLDRFERLFGKKYNINPGIKQMYTDYVSMEAK